MFKNVSIVPYVAKKLIISLFFLLLFSIFKTFLMLEDDIYNNPYIIEILIQNLPLNSLSPTFQEELEYFTEKSALKQNKVLNDFYLIQDQLENQYKKIKIENV